MIKRTSYYILNRVKHERMDVVKVNLLMIIVNDEFQEEMLELLGENDYMATMVASTGEFLQYGNTTFILGVDDEETDKLVQLIDKKQVKIEINMKIQ